MNMNTPSKVFDSNVPLLQNFLEMKKYEGRTHENISLKGYKKQP